MIPSWARDTITVLRPGVVKERGSYRDDWNNPTRHDIEDCDVQDGASQEATDRRMAAIITATVYAPITADVKPTDKIIVPLYPELEMRVVGKPTIMRSPTGDLDHVRIYLSDTKEVRNASERAN